MFGLGKLTQVAIGKWWWQIPLVVTSVVSILLWDSTRIKRRVDLGKAEVRQEFREETQKQVAVAKKIRAKAGTPAALDEDPFTVRD